MPLLVYDYDNTPLSRTYLETYGAALTFKSFPREPTNRRSRRSASWRGRAALIIPQNFERDVRRGAEPVVQLMIDATDSNAATALGNYAQALNSSFARKAVSAGLAQGKWSSVAAAVVQPRTFKSESISARAQWA